MKLYLAAGTYVGTQADARKLDRDFQPVDVPTDKDGLIAYLNEVTRISAFVDPLRELTPSQAIEIAPKTTRPAPISTETDAIVEHILDHASQAQIEQIGLALFTRVGEAARAARVLS